jgi:hypothetical protein
MNLFLQDPYAVVLNFAKEVFEKRIFLGSVAVVYTVTGSCVK